MPYSDPEKRREYARKHYQDNWDRYAEQRRKNHKANLERDKVRQRKWREVNSEKVKLRQREWREANGRGYYVAHAEKQRAATKRSAMVRCYGIDPEEKRAWYQIQQGLCAACVQPMTFEESCIDHCHTTQKLRGLLHRRCNTALGGVKDSPAILEALASYLRSHGYSEEGEPDFPALPREEGERRYIVSGESFESWKENYTDAFRICQ